ncbi:DUF3179 domain-containing protein [Yunchengibacter salinarum]|uniref:DUF3179 domain-containing protein n=1 Tax=Yunchengibacter salinarum TaxID=3133399 RepID=UPI0035B5838E
MSSPSFSGPSATGPSTFSRRRGKRRATGAVAAMLAALATGLPMVDGGAQAHEPFTAAAASAGSLQPLDVPEGLKNQWRKTDFSRATVDSDGFVFGVVPKDAIPAVSSPRFQPAANYDLSANAPVISIHSDGVAKAYPLEILIWHEIVNDSLDGRPVAVTYCPLCNAAAVFDRRHDDRVLEFGVSGHLRHSDLVMYDRQSQTWWQQFTGDGIVGKYAGNVLERLPNRLESFEDFKSRFPDGQVMVPPGNQRPYGSNPYVGYDSKNDPFLYRGQYEGKVAPMARVVRVDDEAWLLDSIRRMGSIETGNGLRLTWQEGQASALDRRVISESQDVGTVTVQREIDGNWQDVPYSVDFAFAFKAFYPDGEVHVPDREI